jgi:hypothetical protein
MKAYSTQDNRDCGTCSLSSYGRDCRNEPIAKRRGGKGRRPKQRGNSGDGLNPTDMRETVC